MGAEPSDVGECKVNIIAQIIAVKNGDKAFILTNQNGEGWCAAIGNTSPYVPIGESIAYGDDGAEFIAYDTTPQGALDALLAKVLAG